MSTKQQVLKEKRRLRHAKRRKVRRAEMKAENRRARTHVPERIQNLFGLLQQFWADARKKAEAKASPGLDSEATE